LHAEYYLATFLGLRAGDKALDMGCGVGGPLGNIALFTGADITGITINQHQVNRANLAIQQAGLGRRCRVKQGDFHHLPFPDNHFDGVYAIEVCMGQGARAAGTPGRCQVGEAAVGRTGGCCGVLLFDCGGIWRAQATCHSPRRQDVFGEAFRVLKPGQCFACYEWVTTEHYNAADPKQREAIEQILHGDGLPDMADAKTVKDALLEVGSAGGGGGGCPACVLANVWLPGQVGFELVTERDVAQDKEQAVSWYAPLEPSWNPLDFRFQFNPVGSAVLNTVLRILEATGLAPAGTVRIQTMLQVAARGLVSAGRHNTFTPMYLLVGRKPLPRK
jgi:sterol 24-C-methyltransferase